MNGTPGWEVPEGGCEGAGWGNEVGKEGDVVEEGRSRLVLGGFWL